MVILIPDFKETSYYDFFKLYFELTIKDQTNLNILNELYKLDSII